VTNGSPQRRLKLLLLLRRMLAADRPAQPEAADWRELVEIADELMVTPALWTALRDSRLPAPPPDAAAHLREWHVGNTVRNLRFRHQLVTAVQALNEHGIEPLLFKGALQLIDGTLPHLGDRMMVDLDLVVPAGSMPAATDALVSLEYRPEPGKPFLHPHELPFIHRRAPGMIELHVQLGSPPTPAVLPASGAWADSSAIPVGPGRARALSPTHQVLHNVLHAAIQDLNHAVGGLPLRQLLTLAGLLRAHGAQVDWASVRRAMDGHGLGAELTSYVWLAHRFAGMPLPPGNRGVLPRLHEARVLASFALVWPAHVHRNLRYAFGRAYLDSLYAHGDRPLKLAAARARHAGRLLRQGRHDAVEQALLRKI
jgi:hypothetical protein